MKKWKIKLIEIWTNSVNEANTNTKYGTSQVLTIKLYLANRNNDSTPDSSITPQTPFKDSETPSTKNIPDLTIGLVTPTKKTIENAETNSSEKNIHKITQYEKIKVENFKETFCKISVITLRKYLTANLPSSDLNVRNWYKQLGTVHK